LACSVACLGCSRNDAASARPKQKGENSADAASVKGGARNYARLSDAELEAQVGSQVKVFCATCHALPDASQAPREEWRHEVELAYGFHKKSPRQNELAPDIDAVVAYFERKAIPYGEFKTPPLGDSDPGKLKLVRTEIRLADATRLPAIAGLTWTDLQSDGPRALLACDMRFGGLYSILANGEHAPIVKPNSRILSNVCHVEPCDLNGDGLTDLVAADLGHFYPTDELFGRVVWLKRNSADGTYEPREIASGLGRVADVQSADFDRDGDQDLVVAEFGLYEAGRVLLLENCGSENGTTKFVQREIDRRHGTVCVPVADLNGDGNLDFAALISQEHEVIEAFLGKGDGTFDRQRIYAAPNPSWGSSGLQFIDMDADGDLDLLYSHGDSFDRGYLKPYHAVRWLENQGGFPWKDRHLADMPGCQRALAGDLDRDGDVDVVAIALQSPKVLQAFGSERFDSICWLEQTAPGQFKRHTLELGACNHLSLALADIDTDGDLDIAVGDFVSDDLGAQPGSASLVIWRNETDAAPANASVE
jgi:hypothetical protein